jgi:hypothetical protein
MAKRLIIEPYKPHYIKPWTEAYEWQGISPDHPVKVSGEHGTWVFRSTHINLEGEVIAIHVYGGIKGNNATRFLRPERVTPLTAKPKRRKKGDPIEEEEAPDLGE